DRSLGHLRREFVPGDLEGGAPDGGLALGDRRVEGRHDHSLRKVFGLPVERPWWGHVGQSGATEEPPQAEEGDPEAKTDDEPPPPSTSGLRSCGRIGLGTWVHFNPPKRRMFG